MSEPTPQGPPYIVEAAKGAKVAFCACGQSQDLPFCDGSHKGTGKTPHVVTLEKDGNVAICSCGRSGGLPYCDGSHKNPPSSAD